jgi:thiol-disulfide isomerase/thioredoxin
VLSDLGGPPTAAVRVGDAAPEFAWTRSDGAVVGLSTLRGQPVVINFWATWCNPCRAEMPRLNLTAAANPGVVFLAVDLGDDAAAVTSFLASLEVTHLETMIDPRSALPARYAAPPALPVSYFIDADGRVRYISLGEMDDARLDAGLRAVSP